jgi:hypothetical protein
MYQPNAVPEDPKALAAYLRSELQIIAQQFATVDGIVLPTLYAAPKRILDGMIVKADGATWNPGAGAGAYIYRGAAWHLLG